MSLKKSILIVEDDPDLAEIMADWLLESYNVLVATDGMDGLRKIENQSFDLIVTDFNMPKLDGRSMVKEVRSKTKTKNMPIIVVSGHLQEEGMVKLPRIHYLPKPIDQKMLLTAIEDLIAPAAVPKFKIDANIINIFIKSTTKVLNGFEVEVIKVHPMQKCSSNDGLVGDISSLVRIESEQFNGSLCISFQKSCYLKIMSTMLMEECTEIDDENKDGVAEINNMIFGNAKSELSQYKLKMAIPTIIVGAQHKISGSSIAITFKVPIETAAGEFEILVSAEPVK